MSDRPFCPLPFATWTRALLAPALVFIATAGDRNYQTDFWHHLSRGRAMAESGTLVNNDLFTYTVAGVAFQDTNWLPQLLYYKLFTLGGLDLVQLINSLTLAGMMGLLVWLCWHESGSLMLASGVGAFTFFGLWQLFIIRPQTFSLVLFVALYGVLELAERRRGWLFVPPVLLAVWVNVHGGFPVGLALIGCYFVAVLVAGGWRQGLSVLRDDRLAALGACLLGSVLATLANPYGWHVYQYVGLTSTAATARHIDEWLPSGLDMLIGKVLALSVVLLVVLFAMPGRRPRVREVCLVICFLPFAVGSARMIAWWLLVAAPILARLLAANLPARWLEQDKAERPSFAMPIVFALLLLAVALSVPSWKQYNPLVGTVRSAYRPEDNLQQVCEQLADRGEGRIFSRFEWSEYLGWALAPRFTVFMDGRIEIYPDEVWREYSALTRGRADWQDLLDRYQVDYLLLDTKGYHAELLPLVERSPVWEPNCQVGDSILFIRQPNTPHSSPKPAGESSSLQDSHSTLFP
jgi:hypothetical protein